MYKKRDLITLRELSKEEILKILNLATEMKNDPSHSMEMLKNKTIGLLFQKPSNRTRVSFEVGVRQMGGHCIYLGPDEINLGVRETTSDAANTLSRYLNGIVARTHEQSVIDELAETATIPVINGLSDLYHPCQALTDLFSIKERKGSLENITVAYIGDGNNVCHSLMLGASKIGVSMNIATPEGYEPEENVVESAKETAKAGSAAINITRSPQDAVKDADVIYTDVWVSMGQETENDKRLYDFDKYQVNAQLTALAKDDHIFMHCLPAHRGQEVTDEVIDGKHSIVFDQAENRLHTQKAILNFLFNTWQ